MNDANVDRAKVLDVASLSDAMDKLRIAGQCLGIKPRDHAFRMAGRAFTLNYDPLDPDDPGTVGDFIDDIPAGMVAVIDNDGREDMTVWGDIMTMLAHNKGIAGTVIDGPCRDVHLCLELGYPIFSRSYSMRTGKDRVQIRDLNVPVVIGGVTVEPGDIVVGGADGVVSIPQGQEDEVLALAEEIERVEGLIRNEIKAGKTLREARMKHQYHSLQTPGGKS
jgi:regulator of RNase E activity RraA